MCQTMAMICVITQGQNLRRERDPNIVRSIVRKQRTSSVMVESQGAPGDGHKDVMSIEEDRSQKSGEKKPDINFSVEQQHLTPQQPEVSDHEPVEGQAGSVLD